MFNMEHIFILDHRSDHSDAHLHHRLVRVHQLNGSVDSVYTALQIWWEENQIQPLNECKISNFTD